MIGITFKKFYLTCIFLSIGHFIYGQNIIIGKLSDKNNLPIDYATVQILDSNNKTIEYTTSTDQGIFKFKNPHQNIKYLKIAHINFETKIIEVELNIFDYKIILTEKQNILKEVILTNELDDLKEINDTIRYNLKKLLNGSEINLKDIAQKLPGITIDANNKIYYNGKLINNILIDGDKLFGKNHQIPLENIKSEIVEEIEVLKNFQDLSSLKNFENSNQTAINIKIKDEYKGIFNHDLELENGYIERYRLHSSSYNFGKSKTHIVADANNTNKTIIPLDEYFQLQDRIQNNISAQESNTKVYDNLPSFLFADDKVIFKKILNTTINANINAGKNKRINVFSTINNNNQFENTETAQFNASDYSFLNNRIKKDNSNSLINVNLVNLENKINETTFYTSSLFTYFTKNKTNASILNNSTNQSSTINQDRINENIKYGGNLYYKKSYAKSLLEFKFLTFFEKTKDNLGLMTDESLYDLDFTNNKVAQNNEFDKFNLNTNLNYTINTKKGNFNFYYNFTYDNSNNSNFIDESNPMYFFSDRLSYKNNHLGINYINNNFLKSTIKFGFETFHTFQKFNNENYYFNEILPNFSISKKINSKITFTVGYYKNTDMPILKNLNKGSFIEDYSSISISNFINPFLIIKNNYNANAGYLNPSKGIYFNASFDYSVQKSNVGFDILNEFNYSVKENIIVEDLKNVSSFMFFEKRFKKLPLSLKFNVFQNSNNQKVISNNIANEIKTFTNNINFTLNSTFKKSFNFNIGLETNLRNVVSNSIISDINRFSPNLNLNLKINKDFIFVPYFKYHLYQSNIQEDNNIFDLGFRATLKINKLNLFVNAENLINLDNSFIRSTISSNNFLINETNYFSLPGFINVGLNFKL